MSDTIAEWHGNPPDPGGVPLEVIGVELAGGDLLVIHVMKLRRKYRDDYAKVMECQGL
jgi:hypothetical protein